MKYWLVVMSSLLACSSIFAAKTDFNPAYSRQLLVVTASNWDSTTGSLQRYERNRIKSNWQPIGSAIPVSLGKQGLAWSALLPAPSGGPVKKEGDFRTPAGLFPLANAFGFGPGYIKKIKLPYTELTTNSICVTDANSRYYNRIISSNKITKKDWQTAESLREIPQNRWGVVIDYNVKHPLPGAGSCAVINVWKAQNQATGGGIAMAEANMEELITWINPAKKPLLIIVPQKEYPTLTQKWKVPTLANK